jgi:uncharacterized protein (DUF1697 family)
VPTLIALFRGINIAGAHALPMKELTAILESLGCQRVRSYIQSGNVVFDHMETKSPKLAGRISAAIRKRRGFEPVVLVLTPKDLAKAMLGNPFPDAASAPSTLAVGFLATVPKKPNLEGMEDLRLKSERFAVVGRCFYLHTPDGFGRSKLASRAEKLLGVAMTARNWRTVSKINEMVTDSE